MTGVTSVGVATCSSGFQKELPTTCPRGLVSVMVDGSVTCYNEKRLAFSGWNFISANGKDSCGLWSATGPTAETSGCMDMEFINGVRIMWGKGGGGVRRRNWLTYDIPPPPL